MSINTVTLCGSTKFKETFLAVASKLTEKGKNVYYPDVFEHADALFLSPEKRKTVDEHYLKTIESGEPVFYYSRNFEGAV